MSNRKIKVLSRISILFLLIDLISPMSVFSALVPNVKAATVAIPVSKGLIGSSNSAKVYFLDLPNGISVSSIKTNSFKYSGNNTVIDSISLENGKIKLKLKGNESTESFPVKGTAGRIDNHFKSNPGNSIWLYSDGRRWQINEYDKEKEINVYKIRNAQDAKTPSEVPPKNTVLTRSEPVEPSTAKWYRNDSKGTDIVDYSSIILSSITPVTEDLMNGDKGEAKVNSGKFLVTYNIPSAQRQPEDLPDYMKGGSAIGWLYYTSFPYYFTGTAKVTSYSYAGTVTFDYPLPTEPTLSGEVALLEPNPNPEKYIEKAVPVKLSLKGSLAAYTDTSNILEWVFYAKKTGNDTSLVTKKDTAKVLSSERQFDFVISKQEAATQPKFTQNYTLTVTVRFAKPIVTASGTITSLSENFTINAGTYNGPPPSSIPIPTPTPAAGKPPVARISMPDQVVAGENFIVSGAQSYDPDGTIVKYSWQHPNVKMALYGKSSDTSYDLDFIDTTQTITLTVTDNDGLTATTSRDIKIVAPAPKAKIELLGVLKQNRKITIRNATKNISDDFPIIESTTRFTITAVSGGTPADIKYSGSLVGVKEVDVLMKTPGQYRAALYVENTAGYSGTTSFTFTVVPDDAPVPYISMPLIVYRDPDNGNKASVMLEDFTVSPDYDYLAKRVWEYRYDSDNNGNFTEESWVPISNANLDRVNFYPAKVGRYEIRLTVTEEFGQPTIDAFVTAADRKSANTDAQPVLERIVTVDNRPPTSDWSW
ncbi:hypothetical protein [Paenibacillus camerounensis]|uniref:hypothetical protein n=1 Tax=Paenibacillus camerounensis TaxID=1243663 RepID=UPI0005A8C34F|nr:hypothetical protein [Paenibacillus camerounensis]